MALQKQTKQLSFSQGINTKVTPELLPVGKLHIAKNIRFNQSGKISRKRGSTAFPTTRVAGGSIGTVRASFDHLSGMYAVVKSVVADRTNAKSDCTPDHIYGYSPTTGKWNFVSGAACVTAESALIPYDENNSSSSFGQGLIEGTCSVDGAYCNGYFASIQASTGICTLNIIDLSTNEVVVCVPYGRITGYQHGKVVAMGNSFVCVFVTTGGTISAATYDTTALPTIAPTVATLGANFAGTGSGAGLFDCFVAPFNGNLYLTYGNNAGGIEVKQFATIPLSGAATATNAITIAEAPVKALTIFGGESVYQSIYVAYSKTGTGTRLNISTMTLTGSALSTPSAVESNAISGGQTAGATSSGVLMLLEQFVGASNYNCILFYSISTVFSTPSVWGAGAYQLGVALMSKIAVVDGIHYVVLATTDSVERTYFLCYIGVSSGGIVSCAIPCAKLFLGLAGARQSSSKSFLPSFSFNGTTGYVAGYKYLQKKDSTTSLFGAAYFTFNFALNNPDAYTQRQIGGLNYFTGGLPGCFDGKTFFEVAFPQSPYRPDTLAGVVGAGALTALGTYQVCYTYEYLDGQGNRQQSAPSIPASVTLAGGQNTITFQFFPPAVTTHNLLSAVFYRTTANGTVFYREKAQLITVMATLVFYTGTLTLADSTLSTQEILYTAGNVIENQCPTAAKGVTIWKDRVWYLTDDGIVYSKNVTDGFPAAFNPVLNLNTLVNKTKPKAIAGIRDKLFAFYSDDIFYSSGDGPSDTGEGAFSPLELAQSGVGCVSSSALVEVQDSVYFQSRDGWRTINGALSVEYIGTEIQNYMSEATTIYATSYLDTLHEVRILDGNRTYVYDTFEKQWSIITGWVDYNGFLWDGVASANKKYVRQRSDGVMLYEDTSTTLDAGSFNQMVVCTGWITMDQFLGFERLYKVLVLGRYLGPHSMTINVFYDYVPQIVETFTFNSSSGNFASFTDSDVYDSDSFAGNGYPFEVAIRPSQQKCQAIRIEIKDNFVSGVASTFDLIGLNLVLGVKTVDAKIRDAATATGTGRPAFVP